MKRIAVVTAGMLAAWLLASGAGSAQVPGTAAPEGVLSPGGELVDREFGVGTHRFGLDRRVEMYQWLRTRLARPRQCRPVPRCRSRRSRAMTSDPCGRGWWVALRCCSR